MPPRANPKALNKLQLKTLALLQAVARETDMAEADGDGVRIRSLPQPHGDHFHLGDAVVRAADATGLRNPAVWHALDRKGLVEAEFPTRLRLTADGLGYDTGSAGSILHRADHSA
jgi:hypothetical protein